LVVIASAHVYPVYPDWLERLLAPFSDPQVGLAYGRQRGAENTKFSEQQVFARWYPQRSIARQDGPFCNNANAAIRRELWEDHPYDESLTGLEDLAWARWAQEQGYPVAYVAEAEVVHVHEENPGGVYNRYRREAMAFKRLFPAERFGLADFLRLASGNIASDLWHAAREGRLLSNFTSIFSFRLMQFWGTYRGYRRPGPVTEQLRRTFYYPHDLGAQGTGKKRDVEPIHYEET
jgi:GT2 family glycosyltransferase